MKKVVIILLMFLAGIATAQTNDTTVSLDKGKAKDMSGKREYITNRKQKIFGNDTMAANTVSIQMVYDVSKSSVVQPVSVGDTVKVKLTDVSGAFMEYFTSYSTVIRQLSGSDTIASAVADSVFRVLFPGANDTTASEFFNNWYSLIIDNPDDTIQLSKYADFPAGYTEILLPARTWTSGKLAPDQFGRYFIRRYGTAGTLKVYYRLEGN